MNKSSSRSLGLDYLRGIAALLVILHHYFPERVLAAFFNPIQQMGWNGVDLFFVLSGFLIGGMLFREFQARGRVDIKRFLIRRMLRIYPPFLATFGCVLAFRLYGHLPTSTSQVLSELFMVQNYVPGFIPVSWSLAVEEHFYWLFAAACWMAPHIRVSGQTLAVSFVLSLAVVLGFRVLAHVSIPYGHFSHYYPTHLRLDALLFGVGIAYAHTFHPQLLASAASHRKALVVFGLAAQIPAIVFQRSDFWFYTVGFTVMFLGYGAILIAMVSLPAENLPYRGPFKVLAKVGKYSYSIYLWHMAWLLHFLPLFFRWAGIVPSQDLMFYVYLPTSIAFGLVMGVAIERPLLRLREWLTSERPAIKIGDVVEG